LANQTAKATEEIRQHIGGMQSVTTETVAAIETVVAAMNQINEMTSGIASAVEEQNAATQEIASNVQQAARGTTEVSANIEGVTEAASQSSAAASQVLRVVEGLSQDSDTLRGKLDKFLAGLRAA
jgi:methyl-accepting chemotaxis protein